MRKTILIFLSFLLSALSLFTGVQNASAQQGKEACSINSPPNITTDTKVIPGITFNVSDQFNLEANSNTRYFVYIDAKGGSSKPKKINAPVTLDRENRQLKITENFDKNGNTDAESNHEQNFEQGPVYFFILNRDAGETLDPTTDENISLEDLLGLPGDGVEYGKQQSRCVTDDQMIINVAPASQTGQNWCTISMVTKAGDLRPGADVKIRVEFANQDLRGNNDTQQEIKIESSAGTPDVSLRRTTGELESEEGASIGSFEGGYNYKIKVSRLLTILNREGCTYNFGVDQDGGYAGCSDDSSCAKWGQFCIPEASTGVLQCGNYPGNEITNPCQPEDKNGKPLAIPESCKTALGKIGIQPESFARSVLVLVLSLSGGILIILFIINGFKLMTSQGDPKKIQEAREGIISAIAGLLLIIFSLSILRLITVDILGIPGFS